MPPARALFFILLLTSLLAGCQRDEQPPPNVLLITVDTLRPDALGWVSGRNETPAIDQLAEEGYAFATAVAHVPLTLPSHTSMMTGLIPPRHGVRDNGHIVSPELETLASRLRDHGYHTAAFVSGFTLQASFGLDLGFDHYNDELPSGVEGWLVRRAEETTAAALAHIREVEPPWFLWVHYFDPHDPYDPPEAFRREGSRGDYDGEVAYTDASIAALRKGLNDLEPPAITIFAADHAESLGEHGENGHGVFIYDTTMVVPLIVHAPDLVSPGRGDAVPRLTDIAPTLLSLLDLPPLEDIDGVDMTPMLQGEAQEIPPAYIESRMSWIAYGWAPLSGLREENWKYIQAPTPELYNLGSDRDELHNLYQQELVRADNMATRLDELAAVPRVASETVQDQALLDKLRSLGYLGAGRADSTVPSDAPDPKDRDIERRWLETAEARLRLGRFDTALEIFAEVLQRDPDNRFATLRSGIAHLKAGRLEQAISYLSRSVELDPEQAEARFALADALSRSGRDEDAIEQWLETVRLQPRRVAAWANLGTLLARAGEHQRAREALGHAFSLDPDNGTLLANMVVLDRAAGTAADTRSMLLEMAEQRGPEFAHHAALGLLLIGAGEPASARPWLQQARPDQHGFAEARWQLAVMLGLAGEEVAARNALGEAMQSDPGIADRARNHPVTRRWVDQP